MAENIERMKKTDPNRPEVMNYFDEIANLFGKRETEITAREREGKESYWLHVLVCSDRVNFSG